MAFAGKDQQLVGNSQRIERVHEQIIFKHRDADVVGASHHMRGRFDFVDLKDGSFVVVALLGFPGTSAEEVGVVESSVVVAPVADVLHRASAGDRGLEARGLRDQPVSHVAMTNWLITQTTRFKAAVTGAGAVEHVGNWGNDDTTFDDAYFLGGRPWEAQQRYHDEAAIFQIDKVKTPTHMAGGGQHNPRAAPCEYFI